MPCYDTRLRPHVRYHLQSSDCDPHHDACTILPPAIPIYDTFTPPNLLDPLATHVPDPFATPARILSRHLSRCPLQHPSNCIITNALCPCILILLLLSGQVRQIMQVLSATFTLSCDHATMLPMLVRPSRPLPNWYRPTWRAGSPSLSL
jgi:hypothetical protein